MRKSPNPNSQTEKYIENPKTILQWTQQHVDLWFDSPIIVFLGNVKSNHIKERGQLTNYWFTVVRVTNFLLRIF